MKIQRFLTFLLMIILCLTLSGCGADLSSNKANNSKEDTLEAESKKKTVDISEMEVTQVLKDRADAEGVSVKELQTILSELMLITADKYGMTLEEYNRQLDDQGKTRLDEFAPVADMMGISLNEYLFYEKTALANMTDEEKEVASAMVSALNEASNQDMDIADEAAQLALEAMGGMAGNRIVTGNYRDLALYEATEIIEEDTTSEGSSGMYMVSYSSQASTKKIIDYFRELMTGTPDYIATVFPNDMGGQVSGTINDAMVYVVIDNEDGDKTTRVDYAYAGDFGMEVDSSENVEVHEASDSDNSSLGGDIDFGSKVKWSIAMPAGILFDLNTLDMSVQYPEAAKYAISEVSNASDNSIEIISNYNISRASENVYMEINSNAYGDELVIDKYNWDINRSVVYMKTNPTAYEVYEGPSMAFTEFDLMSLVMNMEPFDQVVAYSIYDESDTIIDLHFIGQDWVTSVYYDTKRKMIFEFNESKKEGSVTMNRHWVVDNYDDNVTIDPALFDIDLD